MADFDFIPLHNESSSDDEPNEESPCERRRSEKRNWVKAEEFRTAHTWTTNTTEISGNIAAS